MSQLPIVLTKGTSKEEYADKLREQLRGFGCSEDYITAAVARNVERIVYQGEPGDPQYRGY